MRKHAMTRREVLRLGAAASAYVFCRPSAARPLGTPFEAASTVKDVDHIMWGVSHLDEGIDFIEQHSGVKAVIGGVHPNRGTWNALISLGERKYLEILAPDPKQNVQDERVSLLKALTEPRILTWAAGTRDIEALEKRVREAGFETSGIVAGSRKKPDGTLLEWKTLAVEGHDGTVVPFVIQWHPDTVHPSVDSPEGCTLRELHLEHPDAETLNTFLEAMGLDARVAEGRKVKLTALIETPKGEFELT